MELFNFPDVVVPAKYWVTLDGKRTDVTSSQAVISQRKGNAYIARGHRLPIPGTELLANKPYLRVDYKRDTQVASAVGTEKSVNRVHHWDNILGGPIGGFSSYVSWETLEHIEWEEGDRLVANAFADCKPNFDAATTLAEAHKTAQMAVNLRKRLRSMIKQGVNHGFGAQLALDARMEWRYGWRLLSYDLQELAHLVHRPLSGLVVTGSATDKKVLPEKVTTTAKDWGAALVRSTLRENGTRTYRAKASVYYRTRTANVSWSLPVTAWELVPLSWVVDMFVNIGKTLEAWDVIVNADAYTACIGYHYVDKSEGTQSYESTPTCTVQTGTARTHCEREIRARIPWGAPSYIPHFRVRLSSDMLLDLASILKKKLRVPAAAAAMTFSYLQGGE